MAPLLQLLMLITLITTTSSTSSPFTPRSSFLRYYARKVPGNHPLPSSLLSKLSPLSPILSSSFPHSLISPSFCTSAHILCPLSSPSPPTTSSSFSSYRDPNFSNYGDNISGGTDSFKLYSPDANLPVDSFRRYSHSSSSRPDSFSSYASDANLVTANFTSYASDAVSGSGSFSSYALNANVPDLKFTNYDTEAVGRQREFTSYSDSTNSGGQVFAGYSKHADGSPSGFSSYDAGSNTIASTFSSYAESGNAARDNFTSYGADGNGPRNDFRSYNAGGNGGTDTFATYRDRANVGDDTFQSYAEHGNTVAAQFDNYGRSFNPGTDAFKGYGVDSTKPEVGFRGYAAANTTFKSYAKDGITFALYKNNTSSASPPTPLPARWVEPGRFFRESVLTYGAPMTMPDVRDRMPQRSFLPRSVTKELPFSARELRNMLGIPDDTALGKAMADTVAECARPPSKGETKRCVTSAEDMVDFAVSVLGNDAVARTTASVNGSRLNVLIGEVAGIDGGRITKAVSCHQSLFPYMVYYCHSVPRVRAYEAEILDAGTREKINQGVAICHLDTSDWSPSHGAFVALGSGPGEIEVCHWIFEGDLTWTVADQ